MMATYKNGRFTCEVHGDLGEHDAAIENETVVYSGEGQIDGWFCMACLGEPDEGDEAISSSAEDVLIDSPGYEEVSDEEEARDAAYWRKVQEQEEQAAEPQEPVLVHCQWCGSHHVQQVALAHMCPLDPQRPEGW